MGGWGGTTDGVGDRGGGGLSLPDDPTPDFEGSPPEVKCLET